MDVEIDHGGARDAVGALGVARRDRGMIEEAKAHRLVGLGVMAGRPGGEERILMGAGHDRVGCGDRAADGAHHRFPGARRHRGIAVEIDQAAGGRDVPQFLDVMLVVAQHHGIERAFGGLAAHEFVEPAFAEGFLDRANPVGSFGMSRRRQMVEAGPMFQQKCGHAGDPGALSAAAQGT
jgi:hypothetical protein